MDGVLLVAKPAGITSHDVVESVRRARAAKVGHAGTLDPFATGLLVVLVGRATRLQRYLVGLPKAYRTTARMGATSDTGDLDGSIEETGRVTAEDAVRGALGSLTGEIDQRVPAYSAVKVEGERLYRKARRGEAVETPVRRVRIDRLELMRFDEGAQEAVLEVECSSGTYVRQLVMDLGELCGSGAYCTALERTAVGPFSLRDADPDRLRPMTDAVSFLPAHELSEAEAEDVRHGRRIAGGAPGTDAEPVRMMRDGALVAVGERRGAELKPLTVVG